MRRTVRLGVLTRGALAAVLAVPLLLAGSPANAASKPDPTHGLYGAQDPTYDGAFRQSLTLLALQAAGQRVPASAIKWLTDQQCADGGWTPYRKSLAKPCTKKGEDSNSTAMAVQALAGVGGLSGQIGNGIDWLTAQQNDDGGVGYNAGGATDANSTALFVQALAAAGSDPKATKAGGKSPVDALLGLQVGCAASGSDRGAFAFQPGKGGGEPAANDLASAATLFALSGQVSPVTQPGNGTAKALPCGATKATSRDAAPAAATYLSSVLDKGSGSIPSQQGKGADWGTTASAVIALSAFGAKDDAAKAMTALTKHASTYAKGTDGKDAPAALANLVLASVATGKSPKKIAGNAVQRLVAIGPKAPGGKKAAATKAARPTDTSSDGKGGLVAAGVLGAVVLVGVLVLLRRRGGRAD